MPDDITQDPRVTILRRAATDLRRTMRAAHGDDRVGDEPLIEYVESLLDDGGMVQPFIDPETGESYHLRIVTALAQWRLQRRPLHEAVLWVNVAYCSTACGCAPGRSWAYVVDPFVKAAGALSPEAGADFARLEEAWPKLFTRDALLFVREVRAMGGYGRR